MKTILAPLLTTLADLLRGRVSLHLEMLALRQQLEMVASRDNKPLRFRPSERIFWVWLYRLWPSCLQTLTIFKPDTLVRWHRKVHSHRRNAHSTPHPGWHLEHEHDGDQAGHPEGGRVEAPAQSGRHPST